MKTIVLLGLASLMGCGGVSIDLGDGGSDAAQDSQPADSSIDTFGPYPCGTTTCGTGDICVHPCCGGAQPLCDAPDDAGVCPTGDTKNGGGCFKTSPSDICSPPACEPPPPFCAPVDSNQCPEQQPNTGRDCYEECA